MAERIPNPSDEVRFLAGPLTRLRLVQPIHGPERSESRARRDGGLAIRGCAEGRAPALQAGSPGAVPGDSTNSRRRSSKVEQSLGTRSGTVRFRAAAPGRRCIRCSVPRATRQRRPIQAGFVQGERLRFQRSKPGSIPGLRSQRRYGSKVEHRSASPTARVRFPLPAPTARCSGSNTVCKTVERGSTPRRASKASARGRDQRLLNAGLRDRHAPEALGRIRLVAQDAGLSIRQRGFDSLM